MSYNNGDKVKIIDPISRYKGELGVITNVYPDGDALLVRLDRGNELGYFMDEVEMVEAVGEYQQMIKIADELHKSGRFSDRTWVEIKAVAKDLYNAGIRKV